MRTGSETPDGLRPRTVIQQSERAVFRGLANGGGVLLHLDSAAYHGVNPVGALIWELTKQTITFQDLVGQLRDRLDDPPEDLEDDVAAFLGKLGERDLVTFTSPA